MGQDQVLDDELDVDDAAAGVFHVAVVGRVRIQHALAHRQHLAAQLGRIAFQGEDGVALGFELRADAGVLYDIDLRLRPNGASGLLVSSISA
ncbi:hypothetical protein, partial [Chromobacterium vaccinii]|uniref:hypothetical protein n=1 Tax=Chromobacterium vaccinii TaxID=1108595 RepID=UPI003D6DE9B9